jgi:hypothetical protein
MLALAGLRGPGPRLGNSGSFFAMGFQGRFVKVAAEKEESML